MSNLDGVNSGGFIVGFQFVCVTVFCVDLKLLFFCLFYRFFFWFFLGGVSSIFRLGLCFTLVVVSLDL